MGSFMKVIATFRVMPIRYALLVLLLLTTFGNGRAVADTTDIPLSEIKKIPRISDKRPVRSPAIPKVKAESQPQKIKKSPPPSGSWTLLTAVQTTGEGIRLDIDGFGGNIILVREPRNKRLIIQLTGVRFEPELSKVELHKHGFMTARVGLHSDGTWVVFHTSGSELPLFDLLQDGNGIFFKIAPAHRDLPPVIQNGQTMLLTREALTTASVHKLSQAAVGTQPPLSVQHGETIPESEPEMAVKPRQLADHTVPIVIDHEPFSYAVPGRSVSIRAIISGIQQVKTVYCTVRPTDSDTGVVVQMSREAGTKYTYTGVLPEAAPASRIMRYRITAIDTNDMKVHSEEFTIPVKASLIVPEWQLQ